MKRVLAILAAAAAFIGLTGGCSGADSSGSPPAPASVSQAETDRAAQAAAATTIRAHIQADQFVATARAGVQARLEAERREAAEREAAREAAEQEAAEQQSREDDCRYEDGCVPPDMNVGPDGVCTSTPCGSNGRVPELTCAELGLEEQFCPDGYYQP